jgi:DNA-directed RNA polymerase subunit RPC12/RpoP
MTPPKDKLLDKGCSYCAREPEPGWIEMNDNGPIVRCPVCEHRALRSRSQTTEPGEG